MVLEKFERRRKVGGRERGGGGEGVKKKREGGGEVADELRYELFEGGDELREEMFEGDKLREEGGAVEVALRISNYFIVFSDHKVVEATSTLEWNIMDTAMGEEKEDKST